MHILVLQHERVEHPGVFREFLAEDGHTWEAVELDEGEKLPETLDGIDALWVMGGPMDTWQEDKHPWLVPEKAFIRRMVEDEGLPYLGVCLGHQLLAEALYQALMQKPNLLGNGLRMESEKGSADIHHSCVTGSLRSFHENGKR